MSRNIDQEIADMQQELKDLEEAIAQQDAPLDPRTRAVAEAKIADTSGSDRGVRAQDTASASSGSLILFS
jgi:phage shock protein A